MSLSGMYRAASCHDLMAINLLTIMKNQKYYKCVAKIIESYRKIFLIGMVIILLKLGSLCMCQCLLIGLSLLDTINILSVKRRKAPLYALSNGLGELTCFLST